MDNEIRLSIEQISDLIKLSDLEIDPREATDEDISKALIEIERKLNFFNTPLNFVNDTEAINALIVDDMELSIHQLTTMLKKVGVNVVVARTKLEALGEIKKKKFHYVITDLFLPDSQDGFDLIQQAIKLKDIQGADFRIIAISGTDDKEMVQKCHELGIDEFVSKQPDWHQKILKFISKTSSKLDGSEYHKHYINTDICVLAIYKINNQKYVNNIVKEVNINTLTGKKNIILNMEYVKIFSDAYASLFAEIYKSTSAQEGIFALVRPSDDVLRALDYVFLTNAINIFDTIEEAVEYIERRNAEK